MDSLLIAGGGGKSLEMRMKAWVLIGLLMLWGGVAGVAAAGERVLRVGVLWPEMSASETGEMRKGVDVVVKKWKGKGVGVELVELPAGKGNLRVRQAEGLAEWVKGREVEGVLLAAMDGVMMGAGVDAAGAEGVPVVLVDAGVASDAAAGMVAMNHKEAGRMAGRELGGLMGGRGNAVLSRHAVHDGAAELREEGFLEVMRREFPEVRMVSTDYHAGDSAASGKRAVSGSLRRYGVKIEGIFASSEAGSLGALEVLQEKRAQEGWVVKLAGVDEGSGKVKKALEEGAVAAVVVPDYAGAAGRGMEELLGLLVEKKAVEKMSWSGGWFWTQDQVTLIIEGEGKLRDWGVKDWDEGKRVEVPVKAGVLVKKVKLAEGVELEMLRVEVPGEKGIWLGRFEVRQAEWVAVMGGNPSVFRDGERPVENVSWEDAAEFCRKLTERERAAGRIGKGEEFVLPTSKQWEWACREVEEPEGEAEMLERGWFSGNSGFLLKGDWVMGTHRAGLKRANGKGFFDMRGNVQEWCRDEAGRGYRVLRGGCWWADWGSGKIEVTQKAPVGRKHSATGFRVAVGEK